MLKLLDISVVTYNSSRWLTAFFSSLLAQKLSCSRIRLLLRDNGSNDDTPSLLQEFVRNQGDFFAFVHLEIGKNTGFGRGHNENFKLSESDFFLVTNVDLEFEISTIQILLDQAEADDKNVAVWECRQKPFEHPKIYDPVTSETSWCSSACILFRASIFKRVGGYEPAFFMYGEDVELSYRLRDLGYQLRYVPGAVVWHFSYQEPGKTKPLQFVGNSVANVLLRCRYGSVREIFAGFVMYFGLFMLRPRFPHMHGQLLAGFFRLLAKAPRFLSTRRRSRQQFGFRLWDYEIAREGAFYEHESSIGDDSLLVSIIVRTMPGRGGKLQEALASIAAQTYQSIELIVVEDGGETARSQIEFHKGKNRFLHVVYLPLSKSGRCVAGNAGLAAATGELVGFLDDDDLFYADHVEVLVSEWKKNPHLGAVYALGFQVRTDIKSHEPWIYVNLDHEVVYRQTFSRPLLWHHNYLPIQTVIFKRELFLQEGGFDADLENLEDWNLWVRYSLRHDFKMVPKVTSLYRVPAKNGEAAERQKILDEFYSKAQEKHSGLRIETSPTEILEISREMAASLYVFAVPASRLRNLATRMPVLRWVYHPARRLYHLIFRSSNRKRV